MFVKTYRNDEVINMVFVFKTQLQCQKGKGDINYGEGCGVDVLVLLSLLFILLLRGQHIKHKHFICFYYKITLQQVSSLWLVSGGGLHCVSLPVKSSTKPAKRFLNQSRGTAG